MRTTGRHECAAICKRHGAYLITLMGDATDDATPDQLYDCASSLAAAKRIAKAGAEAFDYGHLRWYEENGSLWLTGIGL